MKKNEMINNQKESEGIFSIINIDEIVNCANQKVRDKKSIIAFSSNNEKREFCDFMMYCAECFEILNNDKYFVMVDSKGVPFLMEVKRVFSYPEFTERTICTCCDKVNPAYNYSYEGVIESNEDELPF